MIIMREKQPNVLLSIHNLIKIIETLQQETDKTKDMNELAQSVMTGLQ